MSLKKRSSLVAKRSPSKRKAAPAAAVRIRSIPQDVVLGPQAEAPRHGLAQDFSRARQKVRELSWSDFDREVQSLVRRIHARFAPQAVVGVAHGGVFVGGAVASALGAEFYPVRISRRSRDRGGAERVPKVYGELPEEIQGRRVLVVDDVASSGDTLELARQLARKMGAAEVQCAVLVQRAGGFAPEYVGFVTEGLVVFPWDYDLQLSSEPASTAPKQKGASKKHKKKHKTLKGSRSKVRQAVEEPSPEDFGA